MRVGLTCLGAVALFTGVQAFVPSMNGVSKVNVQHQITKGRAVMMSAEGDDRRAFLTKLGGLGFMVTLASTGAIQPAEAASLKSANAVLASNGLPPMLGVPGGFSPCVEVYGRQSGKKEREPYLVQFVYPSGWVVSRPNIDKNGEEGTVSAGDYQKGDSATFYVGDAPSGSLDSQGKDFFADVCKQAISQKSQNVYEDFKLLKTTKGPKGPNGAQYYIAEFKYTLNTGAGFLVDRRGIASITQVGKNVQALVGATTAVRWKKIGADLEVLADSFRVYDKIAV